MAVAPSKNSKFGIGKRNAVFRYCRPFKMAFMAWVHGFSGHGLGRGKACVISKTIGKEAA